MLLRPQIALLLTIIFIIFILYIEREQNKHISKALWIPSLWLLYTGSKGLGYYLNLKTTIEAGSPPDRYFLIFLGIIAIIILLRRNLPLIEIIKRNQLFTIIILYMLISISWSQWPVISLKRWGREVIAFLMAGLLVSEQFPIKAFVSILRRIIYISLPFSILLIKYYPLYGREYNRWTGELMWIGVASQKNGLAMLCSLSAVFLIWSIWQNISIWPSVKSKLIILIDIFMLLLAIYLMMGPRRTFTYSSTSFLSLLTGLITIILLKFSIHKAIDIKKKLLSIAIIIIILGTLMPFIGKIPLKTLPQILGRDSTLTGRTQIWTSLIRYAKRNIFLGYGFGGFWTTALRETIAANAHSGYLDTILELGVTGLFIFSFFLISIINKATKLIENEWSIFLFFVSIVFMYLVHNISETLMGNFISLPSAMILFISFLSNQAYLKIEK
jgi:O-antigen ligase